MNDASRLLELQSKHRPPPCEVCQAWTCRSCGSERTVRDDRAERRCNKCRSTQLGKLEPVYHLIPGHHALCSICHGESVSPGEAMCPNCQEGWALL